MARRGNIDAADPGSPGMGHHYQESDVACGVAALQMALEAAGHPCPSAAMLATELGTDLAGTRPWAFERYLEKRGVEFLAWHGDVMVGDLRALLDEHAVMVCYQSKELRVGHFAVVEDIDDQEIHLDDPWFGPCKCLPLGEFTQAWESRPDGSKPLPHWVLAIKRVVAVA